MVKFFSHVFQFDHSWATVSEAIFRKYPNPFTSHVLTADVIDRDIDPHTGVLTVTRLCLKQGHLPSWGKDLISAPEAFIIEISTVDPRGHVMETVTRNLSHAKLMLVEEHQVIGPDPRDPGNRTILRTHARIVSNTGWSTVQSRIEGFGLTRIKDHTIKGAQGLLLVIEKLTRGN
ncbi:hypothetical protein HDU96_002295, partial [Phlyctochytrium bullatum]